MIAKTITLFHPFLISGFSLFFQRELPKYLIISLFALAVVSMAASMVLVNTAVGIQYGIKTLQTDLVRWEGQLAENQALLRGRNASDLVSADPRISLEEIGSGISYVFAGSFFVDASR